VLPSLDDKTLGSSFGVVMGRAWPKDRESASRRGAVIEYYTIARFETQCLSAQHRLECGRMEKGCSVDGSQSAPMAAVWQRAYCSRPRVLINELILPDQLKPREVRTVVKWNGTTRGTCETFFSWGCMALSLSPQGSVPKTQTQVGGISRVTLSTLG